MSDAAVPTTTLLEALPDKTVLGTLPGARDRCRVRLA